MSLFQLFRDVSDIKTEQVKIAVEIADIKKIAADDTATLTAIRDELVKANGYFKRLADVLSPEVTGIVPEFNPPTDRPNKGDGSMKTPTIKLAKKAPGMKAGTPMKAGDPPIPDYLLQDNQDGSFTIHGADGTGAPVDISAVAVLTAAVDDATILTVDTPNGMTVACHGLKPGTATVTATATFTSGNVGPFTITFKANVGTGPVAGLAITFTDPTIRV